MTEMTGNREIPPGWYPDPAGSSRQRWWDGAAWSEHLQNVAPEARASIDTPRVALGTPVYNVFIWLIALMPIVSLIAISSVNVREVLQHAASATPGTYRPGELIPSFVSLIVYLVSLLLAYFDWRKLEHDGIPRPFHWAWAFLTVGVYVIARSVIVKRRVGRGLWPIWAWATISTVYLIVVIVKLIDAIPALIALIPELQ